MRHWLPTRRSWVPLFLFFLIVPWLFIALQHWPNEHSRPSREQYRILNSYVDDLSQKNAVLNTEINAIRSDLNEVAVALRNVSLPPPPTRPAVKVDPGRVIVAKEKDCDYPAPDTLYPHCREKVDWILIHWTSDPCYANMGVDGTICSAVRFLGEVESYCGVPLERRKTYKAEVRNPIAQQVPDLDDILQSMSAKKLDFLKNRMRGMKEVWEAGWRKLQKSGVLGEQRQEKRIVVYLGFMTKEVEKKFHIVADAGKGGPLGELVQWSDVIAGLHMLGHKVTVLSEKMELKHFLQKYSGATSPCQSQSIGIDEIYTDIVGYRQLPQLGQGQLKCRVRLLDSFGTEPAFNHQAYSVKMKLPRLWGRLDMHPKQFYTLFPHTPDNSFMGFVINIDDHSHLSRNNSALVYGKHPSMWKGAANYLAAIGEKMELHATLAAASNFTLGIGNDTIDSPSFVNHGVLEQGELYKVLWQTKVFVGLGFPYEGPAPLEALAAGCIFLNPRLSPPHGRTKNTTFFKGKPTDRLLTSQNPYAEEFVGEPWVFTLDIYNKTEVDSVLAKIANLPAKPHVSYEFTAAGMMERLNSYLIHQEFVKKRDLCHPKELWPPQSAVNVISGVPGETCAASCRIIDRICEPAHFALANQREMFESLRVVCEGSHAVPDIVAPGRAADGVCERQSDMRLFSCAGSRPHYTRLCPCRDYQAGQVALCEDC